MQYKACQNTRHLPLTPKIGHRKSGSWIQITDTDLIYVEKILTLLIKKVFFKGNGVVNGD